MRSTVVIASTRESSRAAHAGQTCWRKREKMKLPISLLVLAALNLVLAEQPVTKRSVAKNAAIDVPEGDSSPAQSPVQTKKSATQQDENQTSKRELYEGNYGERNKEAVPNYEVTASPPRLVFGKELQEMMSDQSPTHQIFGVRLPQIAKISDVLSGHGPSYEAAVAKHLYSPVSVYRVSAPPSFEVPTPAASQSAYSNSMANKLQPDAEHEQKLQEDAPRGVQLPRPALPLYAVTQPRLRFEGYPQPLDSGLPRQHEIPPQEIFLPHQVPAKVMSSLFPINDQFGPFRYPGQVVPSEFLHQNAVYQIVSVRPNLGFGNQEGNRDQNYPNQENQNQLKAGQPTVQVNIPVPKQGYHAHPNGAVSYASFSHNLPDNSQYETAAQPQSGTFHQGQLQSEPVQAQQPSRVQPEVRLQSQEQKLAPVKQNFQIPPMLHRLIQGLEKYQPVYQQQPQYIPLTQQIQNQPEMLNALQQHLLFQDPRQLPNTPRIHLQAGRPPAFNPLPQSQLSHASFLQQTSQQPAISERTPRPFSYENHSTQNQEKFDLSLEPASARLTSLPPLKPNYTKYVKPLEQQSHPLPVFLPTPMQLLPTSTPKVQPASDQLISSTTIQPNVKDKEYSKEQSIQKETQPQSQPLKPEITHQSQPTVPPAPIQSTTYLPFVTREPQSIYLQYTTPQPVYQATIRPPSPRHDVVIQQQEIKELFFEPSFQPLSTPHYQNQHSVHPQQEQEIHHLRTQPHHQLYEQLQSLQFQQEIQDINSQQYQIEARQSKSPEKQDSPQQGEPQQYLSQQHSYPFQLRHFQPKLLQSQQSELEEEHQVYPSQQQHGLKQTHQQATEQAQQLQQQASEPAQQQQQQQHESDQAQQQQQYQQHLDIDNQIQTSTLKPSEDTEKHTETVEIKEQPEAQPQLPQESNLPLTTGKPEEQPENLSEPTPNEEQLYLGPLQSSSDLHQIYEHEQQLVAQPEYSPLLDVPSYSDVQYFGKFAKTLFGNHRH